MQLTAAAVILAAGRSQRFGAEHKLLAELKGRPLICWSIAAAQGVGFDPIAVVVDPQNTDVKKSVSDMNVEIVENEQSGVEQNVSLAHGLGATKIRGCDVVVFLADMPFVPMEHGLALLAGLDRGARAVVTQVGDILMPPIALSSDQTLSFSKVARTDGGKAAIASLPSFETCQLNERQSFDIDTVSDLQRAQEIAEML